MKHTFGILGGGTSAKMHAKALMKIPDTADLTGFYDQNEKSAEEFRKAFPAKAYPSYDALLSDPAIESVIICTPSGLHMTHAKQAMNAGKNVIVEKPAVLSTKQAAELLKTEKDAGVKAASVSQLRLYPDIQKLKQAIDSDAFGKITLISLQMHYFRSQAYYDSAAWRGTVSLDGGALMNQGLHGIDLLLYLFGPVRSVRSLIKTAARIMEAEDTAAALLEFESGVLCTVSASSCTYPGMPRRLEICGTDGSAVLTENRLTKFTAGSDSFSESLDESYLSCSKPEAVPTHAHVMVLRDFCDALDHNRQPVSTLANGCSAAALVEAICLAGITGSIENPIYYL